MLDRRTALRGTPLLAAGLLALSASAATAQPSRADADVERAARTIRVEDVRAVVSALAADSMAGRATPSPGLESAARLIAARFRAAGLRPAGDAGSFEQRWALTMPTVDGGAAALGFTAGSQRTAWTYGRDFFVFPSPAAPVEAEALFAGTAAPVQAALPETARGRVVFFRVAGDPGQAVPSLMGGIVAAMRAGAAGVVFVTDPDVGADRIGWFAHQLEESGSGAPIGVAGLRFDAAAALFAAAGAGLDSLARRPADAAPVALAGVRVGLHAAQRMVDARVPNVVAVLPGSDPALRDEYVVLTAHFDHVGVGHGNAHGDSIYNGADDNASGVAALLEAAEAFGALRTAPARSVVFLAVSGEERNLRGSAHWVKNPTVRREGIVAAINLDMVGRNAPDTLVVMGQGFSSLGAAVQRAAAGAPDVGFHLRADAPAGSNWFGRSDHMSFVGAGVPVLFFTSLEHPDYHQLSDHVDGVDADKVTRVARLLFRTAHTVATEREAPRWTATGVADAARAAQQ